MGTLRHSHSEVGTDDLTDHPAGPGRRNTCPPANPKVLLEPKPAGGTSGPPFMLFFKELGCRRSEFGDWCVEGEEVDVDASYEFVSELDVAGSGAVVGGRERASGEFSDQNLGDGGCLAFRNPASARNWRTCDIPDGENVREPRREGGGVDRDPPVLSEISRSERLVVHSGLGCPRTGRREFRDRRSDRRRGSRDRAG